MAGVGVVYYLRGVFGLSEGTEKALVADMVGDEKRGTAYGFYNLAFGITVFPASLLFGLVWTEFGVIYRVFGKRRGFDHRGTCFADGSGESGRRT